VIWYYNTPLTQKITTQLQEIDNELTQARSALTSAQGELERALRIVDAAEKALTALSQQTAQAQDILGGVKGTIDDKLLPGLKTARDKVDQVKGLVESLRSTLQTLNNLPLVNINLPGDEMLTNIIGAADSLDSQITNVEDMAKQASTFASDTSYLLGGDLSDTRNSLSSLLEVIKEYNGKVTGWQEQIAILEQSIPGWIDKTSITLTVLLLWFAFSQTGLFLIGYTVWKGGDPFAVLRKTG
jgi:small-conductance mechanosensitive channel